MQSFSILDFAYIIAKVSIISLPALVLRTFVVHQPPVVVLRLLNALVAGHGVHGDEWLVEPFVQASNRLFLKIQVVAAS